MESYNEEKQKTPMHQSTGVIVEFLWNGAMFALKTNENFLQLECIKSRKPVSLSSRNASVHLHRIIATSCGSGQWKVDGEGKPILDEKFFDFLHFRPAHCFILTIHFWDKLPDGRRKCRTMNLRTADEEHCKDWRRRIELRVRDVWKEYGHVRPQSLLVFVNPFGGKKNGEKVYRQIVSPLFKMAGIKETVIFTQREGEANEYLTSNDLSSHDGVIAMGGDGTFNEIANGVLQSTQKKHRVGLDRENGELFSKEIRFEKPDIKLGVIPVGTANMLTYTSMGVVDPETATLQIIAGETHPLDVCSMHNEKGKFVTFFFLGCSYGMTEKILTLSEKFRYFGLFRYEMSAINALLELSSSSCEITFLPVSNMTDEDFRTDKTTCINPCPVCVKTTRTHENEKRPAQSQPPKCPFIDKLNEDGKNSFDLETISDLNKKEESPCGLSTQKDEDFENESKTFPLDNILKENDWKIIQTPYVSITAFNTACKFKNNPNGFSPLTHLADGTCDLQINKSKSRMEFIRSYRAGLTKQGSNHFPCMEFHRARAFHFRSSKKSDKASVSSLPESRGDDDKSDEFASDNEGLWTIDGELMKSRVSNITVWVHRGLIDIFSTKD